MNQRQRRLEQSGVIDFLDQRGLDAILSGQPPQTRAIEIVAEWTGSQWPFLLLLGDIGIGKTVSGAWLLSSREGLYVKENDLVSRHQYIEEDPSAPAELAAWMSTPLLVIDELGWERDVEQTTAAWAAVLKGRPFPKRTLVLGGLDKPESITRAAHALGLTDDGGTAMVRELHGRSLRRSAEEEDDDG